MDFQSKKRWRKKTCRVGSGTRSKRHSRRSRYTHLRGLESLEKRMLLASVSHSAVVSENPADTTPHIVLDSSQKMKAFEQIGRTIYAGGKFDEVQDPLKTTTYTRDNFFAFDADTGVILPLNLSFNGTVSAIEASEDETALFIAGSFTEVDGINLRGIVKYDLVNEQIDPTFAPEGMRTVSDVELVNGSLIIAGNFNKHLLALDPTTGEDLGTIDISVEGEVNSDDSTKVSNIAVSPDGTRLVATGNFETVNDQFRERAFMLNLGSTATLSTWYAPRFDVNCDRSSKRDSAQGVDFSPDGSYFVIVTNGGSGFDGICDAAARFETANVSSTVEPTWINWAGGDTLWSVAITDVAVYVGGHQRWLDNSEGDDEAGPGAVSRPGIGAIDPVTGMALPWNPTKSRNEGTRVLFATPEGLWVGSDGEKFGNEDHFGIGFVPLDLSPSPDTTRPDTLIDSGPLGAVIETSATFSFSASEPSTFQCRLDGAAFTPCTSPVTYENLSLGPHTMQVVAVDGSYNMDATPEVYSWTVYEPGSELPAISWAGSISASSDDAEEDSNGRISLRSSDLELILDKSDPQVVGLRFTSVNIPPGASIQNAYIQFQADEVDSDPTSLTIYGEAVDDASTFTSTNGNITSRPTTSASVPWSPMPWTTRGQAGPDQQTSNIAEVIQEIVNRPGWSSRNALAIMISGTGARVAEAIDGVPSAAARLHVEYKLGNLAPTTSGIADVNVNTDAPDTVINLFSAFDDFEDLDSALTYSIENITKPSLFTSTAIDGVQGTLTLDYAAATNDTADITIRATDTDDPALFVETTFTVTVAPMNQPPTTTGITDVFETEGAGDTTIALFDAFDDPEDLDSELTFSVEANTNSDLFTSVNIDGGLGTLTLNYAPEANGMAEITVRATDSGIPTHSVETTFMVELSEVNSTPVLSTGSVDHLTVVQNSAATSLGLTGLSYGPGGGADENAQTLSYSVTSVPSSFGDVVLSDGTTVTPGDYTLAQIQGMQFLAAPNVFGGPETFSFTVTDNGTTNGVADFKTLNQSVVIDVIEAIADPIIFDVQISASSDDAEEKSTGGIRLASSDLELIEDKSDPQVVGLRFTGVNIQPGSTIQNAYIQFQADEVSSVPTSLTIFGEAVDNASTFRSINGNITSRPTTSASVAWSPMPWTTRGQAGPDQQTSNIAAVIQEIVNRPGWASSNALAIIITGSGERVAESIDGNSSGAARLHIEYLQGNLAPTTSGIADVNVNTDAPDTVINLFSAFDDFEDPQQALTYSIENNTNSILFNSTAIDAVLGTLTLDYADATNDTADITIRATDTGDPALFVETTFTVTVAPVNQPPTTTGITDVLETEGAGDTTIDLNTAFDDSDGLDSAFTFSVEANSNSDLFTSVNIDGGLGTLTLDYDPEANGMAEITVRATDSGIPAHSVETTFIVDLSEVNDAPVLTSGSVDHLTVVQNSPAISLGLAGLGYGPGGGADENVQTLNYAVTSVPSSLGDIVLSNGTTVTPGDYTLAQIQGMQFLAAPNVLGGPETFSFTVTDNGTTNGTADFKTLNQSVVINVIEASTDPIIVDVQISASSDDAEERTTTDGIRLISSDLELIQDKSVQQVVGLRFTGVNIPPGASIQNAYIQFQADEVSSDPASLTIFGEAIDNAATFTSTDGNITSRLKTSASVAWSPMPWTTIGQAGPDERTSNIAEVIQEIVNRAGWSSSNALAIIFTGTGGRVAEAFDGLPGAAARLHIEYLPGNLAPATSGNADALTFVPTQRVSPEVRHLPPLVEHVFADDVDRLVLPELSTEINLHVSGIDDHTESVSQRSEESEVDELYQELGNSFTEIEGWL